MAGNENFNLSTNDESEDFTLEFGEVVNIGGGGGTSDFNQLSNRPKYAGETMTGSTNIPAVPTKTSDLDNDSDYQTGSEVESAISEAIGEIEIPTKTSELENDGSDGNSTYVEASDLATVATSGKYTDLSDKPTIPAAQVNSDWNANSGVAEILNKPTIPTVNDATLTINQNNVSKGTFTANDSDNVTVNLTDTTYSAFTGTDGNTAGTSGLVPAPATTDAGKFLKADGTWDTAGGGGGDTVYSAKTTSNSNDGGAVYIGGKNASQTIYQDPTTTDNHRRYFWALPFNSSETANTSIPGNDTINIGGDQLASGDDNVTIGHRSACNGSHSVNIGFQAGHTNANGSCVCVGDSAQCFQNYGVALGRNTQVNQGHTGSVALGYDARTTRKGEIYIGTNSTFAGYDSTKYRVIGGVHDGQLANDAVTVSQVNATIDAINTALSTNIPHIGA